MNRQRTTRNLLLPLAIAAAAATLAVAAFAGPATAAGPAGDPPDPTASPTASLATLLTATRSARTRTRLGLPSYAKLLGRGWERRARRADAALARRIAPAHGASAQPSQASDDALRASDSLRGRGGRQTRRIRIAAALEDGCPRVSPQGEFELRGQARGEYVVTTIERVGRYDVTTVVVIDVRFAAHAATTSRATLNGIFGDGGTISVTRRQTARDRRSRRTRPTGPTQRYTDSLSPLLELEGGFAEFVRSQDDDESPAPRRPLRAATWSQTAQAFVTVVFTALERELAVAEGRLRTPNTCVQLGFDAPERLAPGQSTELVGVLRQTQGTATEAQLLRDARVTHAETINDAGQEVTPAADLSADFQPGRAWYLFRAPEAEWPEDRPIGVRLVVTTRAGIADAGVSFKPLDGTLYFRVLGASISNSTAASGEDGLCGPVSGRIAFSGSFAETPFSTDDSITFEDGEVSGHVGGRVHARWHDHHLDGCQHDDHGNRIDCTANPPDQTPRPDGTWPVGFSVRGTGNAGEVELRWGFDHPFVGFVDAGEEECHVYVYGRFPPETSARRIPLDTLLGPDPVTLTLAGSGHLDRDGFGAPASIDHRWSYSLTIQRVDREGRPLR